MVSGTTPGILRRAAADPIVNGRFALRPPLTAGPRDDRPADERKRTAANGSGGPPVPVVKLGPAPVARPAAPTDVDIKAGVETGANGEPADVADVGAADVALDADALAPVETDVDPTRSEPGEDVDLGEPIPIRPAVGDAGASDAAIAEAAADHREWVRQAVAKYERPLAQYAGHMLSGDAERARDLVQEVFLRLCDQDRHKVADHLAEWLYTVCRNLAIDVKRKERRMRLLTEAQTDAYTTDDPEPTESAEREDSLSAALRLMEELPHNQREVIRLKFQHGLSYKQISEVTNLSVTNVGFLIHTGLKALRKKMTSKA